MPPGPLTCIASSLSVQASLQLETYLHTGKNRYYTAMGMPTKV